jgi:hypothetical protein
MSTRKQETFTIATHQMLTEQRLKKLLDDAGSSATLDRVKKAVFELDTAEFQSFVLRILAALNCDGIDNADQATLEVIQDAWNYFPHGSLGGQSPAEMMASSMRISNAHPRRPRKR